MITAHGVTKRFGRLEVLRGLDLEVPRGLVTAVIGPNASGKTTFNRIVLGLVQADGGDIRFDGQPIRDSAAYRGRIGYMPQSARFPENLCAADVFGMLSDLRGPGAGRDEELVDRLEIGGVLNAPLRTLSGGMRQRVNAALAFYFRPDLLILDEPTAGLDPISSSTLKDKILRERSAGRTFVVTSHVLSELEELADRIVFLLDGHARFSGSPEDLKQRTGQVTLERSIAHLMRAPQGGGSGQ